MRLPFGDSTLRHLSQDLPFSAALQTLQRHTPITLSAQTNGESNGENQKQPIEHRVYPLFRPNSTQLLQARNQEGNGAAFPYSDPKIIPAIPAKKPLTRNDKKMIRVVLIPDSLAASRFPPVAYALRPSGRYVVTTQATRAHPNAM